MKRQILLTPHYIILLFICLSLNLLSCKKDKTIIIITKTLSASIAGTWNMDEVTTDYYKGGAAVAHFYIPARSPEYSYTEFTKDGKVNVYSKEGNPDFQVINSHTYKISETDSTVTQFYSTDTTVSKIKLTGKKLLLVNTGYFKADIPGTFNDKADSTINFTNFTKR